MSTQSNGTPTPVVLNNRYRLLAVVASGGMATVYKAQDTLLGRVVAVKIPRDQYAQNPDFARRFREEAQAAANLNHPNIVAVHDVGRDLVNGIDRWYLVMEYVDGQDLKQAIRDSHATGRSYSIEDAIQMFRQISEGVAFAHRRGLVHCDLKPQNVLLTTDGRAKVTDFGIARAYTSAVSERQDLVWGTPQYYSPEQAQGQSPTPASDVYSIGIMLYEALAGRLPFDGRTAADLARQHMTAPPPPLHEINPSVTLQLEGIINRALAKDPAQRYRDADQLARILQSYLQQGQEQTYVGTGPVPTMLGPGTQRPAPPATVSGDPSVMPRANAARSQPAQPRGAPAQTAASATSATTTGERAARGPDLLLILLGTVAILCVLGLVALYAVVLSRLNAPPPVPATPAPPSTATMPGIVATIGPTPTRAPAAVPTPGSVAVPSDLTGRVLDEPLSATLRSVGWTLVVTEVSSTAPERTILGTLPQGGSALSVSGTLTVSVSTGGRFDVKATMPPVVLDSVRFGQEVFAAGQLVSFQVRWQSLGRVGRNMKVFVHVWGPNGSFIQPDDREPRNAGIPAPTSAWATGTIVLDTYDFVVPQNAPRGQYRIEVGMYDPGDNNQRLRVADYGRTPVNSLHPDAVIVRVIEIR